MRRMATWTARAVTYFVYAWVIVNQIILILGFALKLFGANPAAGFTEWAYRNLERVMEPFRGMFPVVELNAGTDVKPVIDTSILFAMLVYAIIAIALHSLIGWLAYRLAVIDQRHAREQEAAAAAARSAAEAELRAQQVAAMAARDAAAAPAASTPMSLNIIAQNVEPTTAVLTPPPAAPGSSPIR